MIEDLDAAVQPDLERVEPICSARSWVYRAYDVLPDLDVIVMLEVPR